MSNGDSFRALVLRDDGNKSYTGSIETLTNDDLPEGDVLVAVEYSDVNYKDGLAVANKGKIVRKLPLVPGIDFAGTVLESSNDRFNAGDKVVLTGWGVGESYWGGYTQRQRTRGDWLVHLPEGLDTRAAMAVGTAGFTAMQCVLGLEDGGVKPDSGPVVVTGAAGGVGSIAVAILAKLGYEVHAVTGRPETQEYLRSLGAVAFLSREEMAEKCRPLEKGRWAGAVDTVGSTTLARVAAEMLDWGTISACGLAGGFDLPTTVMPFILRGVRLQGINSVLVPIAERERIWARVVEDLPLDKLEATVEEIGLDDLPERAEAIVRGQVRGRTVVDVNR
ncbi:MAG: MDR family oxidoreductase [Gammaproteobacteria bacterium]